MIRSAQTMEVSQRSSGILTRYYPGQLLCPGSRVWGPTHGIDERVEIEEDDKHTERRSDTDQAKCLAGQTDSLNRRNQPTVTATGIQIRRLRSR